MSSLSTSQAAKKLGIGIKTLSRYIQQGKIPAPQILKVGSASLHAWTEEDIEHVRKLLPKIANGRKTRYKKKNSGVRSQESVKRKAKKKTQPRAAALQTRKKKPKPRIATATSTAVPHKKKK